MSTSPATAPLTVTSTDELRARARAALDSCGVVLPAAPSPAVGEVVADLVRGEPPFTDVTPLRAERFAEHAHILEANIV